MTAHQSRTGHRPTGGAPSRPLPDRPGPGHPTRRSRRRPPAPGDLAPGLRLAAAERLAAALGRWYLDAQAGRVEVKQLRQLLTPTAEQRVMASVLRARARQRLGADRPRTMLEVRRVVVREAGDHYEALALVDDGVRTVAVAAVLHATDSGWRISDLARPDDGVPALPPPLLREDDAPYEALLPRD